jgi:hypothetical protein
LRQFNPCRWRNFFSSEAVETADVDVALAITGLKAGVNKEAIELRWRTPAEM